MSALNWWTVYVVLTIGTIGFLFTFSGNKKPTYIRTAVTTGVVASVVFLPTFFFVGLNNGSLIFLVSVFLEWMAVGVLAHLAVKIAERFHISWNGREPYW